MISLKRLLAITFHFIFLLLHSNVESLDLSQCTMPLGMESGEIRDSDIEASSSFEAQTVGPQNARIRKELFGGAWCPKNQITSEGEEWLQIDFHTVRVIRMTETQGRFGNGQGQEYAENYKISYWRPQLDRWVRYRDHQGNEILKGNINTYLASKVELNPAIIASKIRFIPYSLHRRTICMRVEAFGCKYTGGLLSYSVRQGSRRGDGGKGMTWDLYDHTYDGQWVGQYLRNGLGQLTDGLIGPADFKDDFYRPERGKNWMGWKHDLLKNSSSEPLEILFTFDSIRQFNAIHIYTSNQFTKDIQVFSEARLYFSVGGKLYPGDPILYVTKEDCIFEDPKNVTIKLHHRVGQYVKMELFWAAKWILISEITFDSQVAIGNFTEETVTTSFTTTTALNPVKEVIFTEHSNVSSRVVIDNPINVANSMIERTPTVVEDLSPTTIVMTAVISSCIAVVLVLVMILIAFLMRNRLFAQEKMEAVSHPGSLHYNGMGNNDDGRLSRSGYPDDFGYATPTILFTASQERKSKSPPTLASSLSRDYEPSKPTFCSFGESNANDTFTAVVRTSNGGPSSCGMAEYYSSAPIIQNSFLRELKTDEYEYVSKESELYFPTSSCAGKQKSPRKKMTPNPSLSPLFNNKSHRTIGKRLRELKVPEIPQHHLEIVRKLGDGVFGSIFVGEMELPGNKAQDKRLVTVKRLHPNASEKDKLDFLEEVRLLSSLKDRNVTQVVGLCTNEEPLSVALEFLDYGDLCQFLKANDALQCTPQRRLSFGDLLYLAVQIASGMKFLEAKGVVHRDLATRNCVVGKGLLVKVSHFATDIGLYSEDYYKIDGNIPLPIRWMAWESLFLGKYSSKTDSWSMGVTLYEILTFCRQRPYASMTDQEVIHNLRRLSLDDDRDPFEMLDHPYNCPRDIFELMCDSWRRNDDDRPPFWEFHSFLMRKNMNHNATAFTYKSNAESGDLSSYYV